MDTFVAFYNLSICKLSSEIRIEIILSVCDVEVLHLKMNWKLNDSMERMKFIWFSREELVLLSGIKLIYGFIYKVEIPLKVAFT